MPIEFITFGLKHRPHKSMRPATTTNVDARFLPNPPKERWNDSPAEIARWIEDHFESKHSDILDKKLGFVWRLLTVYSKMGLPFTLGFYCYGGKHRSPFLANLFASYFRQNNIEVNVRHLDVDR